MKFISTRGQAKPVGFVDACLAGLAPDGGLYVPESWPSIEPAKAGEPYVAVASRVISAFAGDELSRGTVETLCERAYAGFAHKSVAPLVQWGPDRFIMELHHGPTLAFKDVAMQLIAQLFDHVLAERGLRHVRRYGRGRSGSFCRGRTGRPFHPASVRAGVAGPAAFHDDNGRRKRSQHRHRR